MALLVQKWAGQLKNNFFCGFPNYITIIFTLYYKLDKELTQEQNNPVICCKIRVNFSLVTHPHTTLETLAIVAK